MARLLRLATAARGPLLLTVIAIVVAASATIGHMVVAAQLIAAAAASTLADYTMLAALLLALIAVRATAAGLTEAAAQRLSTQARSHLRLAAIASVLAQGRRLPRERTGEIVTTIDGVEALDVFYRRFVPQAIATAIVPLWILAAVAYLDPISALLLGLTGPLIPLFMWLIGTRAQQHALNQWTAMSHLGGRFLDTLQGLPTLTAFGRAPEAALALSDSSEDLRTRTMSVLRVAFLSGFVLELAASLSTAIVAASIGVRLIEGWMPLESGLAVLLLTPEFYLPFRHLGQRHHAGMEGVAAAERIFRLIDTGQASPAWLQRNPVMIPETGTVSAVGVSYSYPDSDSPAIRDITLTCAARSLTVIVGESGAGKSTLLAVLLRLIEPTGGRVLVNGRPADSMTPADWRRHFAYVPQRPRFMHGSLLDNVRMARPDASVDEVIAAARLAHADTFIDALPHKYDTVIDETASTLSGGERQRLAIARALLKRAPVLVLDEPTSHLDTASEALITDSVRRIRRECTVIAVSHRLDLTQAADHVVRLDGGAIVFDDGMKDVA